MAMEDGHKQNREDRSVTTASMIINYLSTNSRMLVDQLVYINIEEVD